MQKYTSVPEKIIYIIMIGMAGLLDGAICLCGAVISVILACFDVLKRVRMIFQEGGEHDVEENRWVYLRCPQSLRIKGK